jgi:hypothetical protein
VDVAPTGSLAGVIYDGLSARMTTVRLQVSGMGLKVVFVE